MAFLYLNEFACTYDHKTIIDTLGNTVRQCLSRRCIRRVSRVTEVHSRLFERNDAVPDAARSEVLGRLGVGITTNLAGGMEGQIRQGVATH
jgi:hypothetical protein